MRIISLIIRMLDGRPGGVKGESGCGPVAGRTCMPGGAMTTGPPSISPAGAAPGRPAPATRPARRTPGIPRPARSPPAPPSRCTAGPPPPTLSGPSSGTPSLQEPRLIRNQHRGRVTQVPHHVPAHRVGVPRVEVQQPLHPVRRHIPGELRQRPPVLPLRVRQQAQAPWPTATTPSTGRAGEGPSPPSF